jgi:hypothetical protein
MVPGSWYTQYMTRFPNENRIYWLWLLHVYAILKVAAIEGYGHSYIGKLVSVEDG